jgi:hypothetical protein
MRLRSFLHHVRPAPILVAMLLALLMLGGRAPRAATVEGSLGPSKYNGPGSCSSTSCHGGVQPRHDTTVLQNEYSTWVVRDKHAHAYAVLSNDVAKRMAHFMGIENASTAPRCLACHALDVPPEERAKTFDMNDGVSCECCHGPASAWLGPHTTKGWNYKKSMEAGMYDTRDLMKRSERCLTCHLGTKEKVVDHELIAAGHPDLYFELDSFMSVMPSHWTEVDADGHPIQDPWYHVKLLGTGQAVQLREQMRRVAREAQTGIWPEYAELDCFACHHSLVAAKDSWRLKETNLYANRRPGNPPFNLSRYAVFHELVQEMDRGSGQQLDAELGKMYVLMSSLNPDRAQVASQANAAAEVADRLAQRISSPETHFDQATALRLLQNISRDADSLSLEGERVAEQAAMAVDSLFVAATANGQLPNQGEIKSAIAGMFHQFDDPSAYNASNFARQLKSVNALLK